MTDYGMYPVLQQRQKGRQKMGREPVWEDSQSTQHQGGEAER